jgi:hypothetical protein
MNSSSGELDCTEGTARRFAEICALIGKFLVFDDATIFVTTSFTQEGILLPT